MSNTQLVIFDIAGTTVKDTGNVATAFIDAFREYDLQVTKESVSRLMGFRKEEAIRRLLQELQVTQNGELVEDIHDAFTRNMINVYESDPQVSALPHAEEIFQQLKQWGIRVALNTGFTRLVTNTILRRLQWKEKDTVDAVICSDEVMQGRPYPYMIYTIMQQLHVDDPGLVVKVGDTMVDVEEGRRAGCGLVVSVTTGAYTRSELEQYRPDCIIDSLSELPLLI